MAARAEPETGRLDLVLRAALVRPRMGLSLLGDGHEGRKDSLRNRTLPPARTCRGAARGLASAHVRLRDRRGRLGRLRAGQPPDRGPGRLACSCSRPAGRTRTSSSTSRAAFSALYRTAQDWDHSTIYEPYANDRRIYLPRGKVLGGSSSINAMVYIRGNPLDYDEWGARLDLGGHAARTSSAPRTTSAARPSATPRRAAAGLRGALAQSARADVHRRGDARRACPRTRTSTAPSQDGVGWYQVTQRAERAPAPRWPTCTRR